MEFNNIYLLKGIFNYFNRKIYFYESLEDYLDLAEDYEVKTEVNFNPNEGVNTSLIVSIDSAVNYFEYCYLLVTDKDGNIISRWYIKDATRNLSGQFTLTLRRDVVAESFASPRFINEAPIYVEKGILEETDPMIVNDEGMRFNQIKKQDFLLAEQDDTLNEDDYIGYVVGYISNDAPLVNVSIPTSDTPSQTVNLTTISQDTGIPESTLQAMITGSAPVIVSDISFVYGTYTGGFPFFHFKTNIIIPSNFLGDSIDKYGKYLNVVAAWEHAVALAPALGLAAQYFSYRLMDAVISNLASSYSNQKTNFESVLQNDFPNEIIITNEQYEKLKSYRGQVLSYGGNYYDLDFSNDEITNHSEIVISKGENTYFDNLITNAISDAQGLEQEIEQYDGWEIYVNYQITNAHINLKSKGTASFKASITTAHNTLEDAPYSMFVIPYGNITQTVYPDPAISIKYPSKNQVLKIASQLAIALGDSLLDIQLLPYMPQSREFLQLGNGQQIINLYNKTNHKDYEAILDGSNNYAGAILFPTISNFNLSLRYPLKIEHSMKIDSQCCFYRLCSPNYNGVFEFNLAKDGGEILYFYADCTYKPHNPFIRITPQFSFLYGLNYKDGRGLICGGDFSLPIMKDAYITYQLQNKNFSSIFARDIQNLDFTQKQERFKEPFLLGAGAIGAGAAGAIAGSKGGPYGAVAGAVAGLGAGGIGGAIDAKLNEERRAEAKDYAIDRFKLNLGNIQALPECLTKSSAYDITSKIFPFIEYYTCTNEEITALKNKIKYDGMTVGRIDTISTFMGGNEDQKYFKGQLIRALGIFDNEDFVEALYNELAKGVYI